MLTPKQTFIPNLVRVKPGALDRMGVYAERYGFARVLLFFSQGLDSRLMGGLPLRFSPETLKFCNKRPWNLPVSKKRPNFSINLREMPMRSLDSVVAKPWMSPIHRISFPASLSFRADVALERGFCSPQSSLTVQDRRRSMASAVPFGVILDTAVCLNAPEILWHSGVGDLVSKLTAVTDWKMAFHPVHQFIFHIISALTSLGGRLKRELLTATPKLSITIYLRLRMYFPVIGVS